MNLLSSNLNQIESNQIKFDWDIYRSIIDLSMSIIYVSIQYNPVLCRLLTLCTQTSRAALATSTDSWTVRDFSYHHFGGPGWRMGMVRRRRRGRRRGRRIWGQLLGANFHKSPGMVQRERSHFVGETLNLGRGCLIWDLDQMLVIALGLAFVCHKSTLVCSGGLVPQSIVTCVSTFLLEVFPMPKVRA